MPSNLTIFALFVCLHFCIVHGAKSSAKPNIIIFVADDLGWDDVSFHGSKQIRTPNIDSLAADGIVLNNYYTSPVCTPSRGALLSSIHPIHSGTQNYVIFGPSPWGLPLNSKLLPQYLSNYNYISHAVGKWHLGFYQKVYTPTFRGFDSHVGFWAGSGDYFDHTLLEDRNFWGLDFRHNLDPITDAGNIYSTDYFTKRSLDVISNHNTSVPLFLYVAYQSVHGANSYARLQAPQKYIDMFSNINNTNRRIFAAMAYAMDESIGIIFDALNQRKLLDNSIVVFISDNGGPASGFTGNAACNWPLRGVKATLWEGGIRVPAVIWSPLLKNSGYVSNALIHVADWLPTILSTVDRDAVVKLKKEGRIYGMSMWKTLSYNKVSPRKEILHNIDPIWNVSAIRVNDWKLVQGLVFPKWSGWYPPLNNADNNNNRAETYAFDDGLIETTLYKMGRKPNYSVLQDNLLDVDCGTMPSNATTNCQPDISPCLYNITSDPCEFNNLAQEYPEVVDALWKRILQLNDTAIAPLTQPGDPFADPKLHNYLWTFWDDYK